jgi:hypothetical protein
MRKHTRSTPLIRKVLLQGTHSGCAGRRQNMFPYDGSVPYCMMSVLALISTVQDTVFVLLLVRIHEDIPPAGWLRLNVVRSFMIIRR